MTFGQISIPIGFGNIWGLTVSQALSAMLMELAFARVSVPGLESFNQTVVMRIQNQSESQVKRRNWDVDQKLQRRA